MQDDFSMDQGGGMVWGWFKHIILLCTLFTFWLHQLHLRSSDIRFWRLGTPDLKGVSYCSTIAFLFLWGNKCSVLPDHFTILKRSQKSETLYAHQILTKGNGYPLQYSGLENSMDCIVHGVAKSWIGLSDFHFQTVRNSPAVQENWVRSLGWEDPLEKGMATHSTIFAWEIPWTEEPGGLQSVGSQGVRHNLATNTFNTF